MAGESLVNHGICGACGSREGFWRCDDCSGPVALCRGCMRGRHSQLPFHRIKWWNGRFYTRDWLVNLGGYIALGHCGDPCPSTLSAQIVSGAEPHLGPGSHINIYFSPSGTTQTPASAKSLIITHKNGMHKISVIFCRCNGHASDDIQLISARLLPLSLQNIRSAFTFDVLEDFRLASSVCKVTAYAYFKKIRRHTDPVFAGRVKVCSIFHLAREG